MDDREEELLLIASVHYNMAGKRYRALRERFWNRFIELLDQKKYDEARVLIQAFALMRKVNIPTKHTAEWQRRHRIR